MKIIRDPQTLNSTPFTDLLTAIECDLSPQDILKCHLAKDIRIKPKGGQFLNFEINETVQPLVDALL